MDVYTFNENDEFQQAAELRKYFHDCGAEISPELSSKGIEDDMHKIIGVCDVNFNNADIPEGEIESSLNSIVSVLMVMQTTEKTESLIVAFCEKLQKAPNCRELGMMALRVLYVFFQSMTDKICLKYHIYLAMVQVSGQIGEIGLVYKSMETLKDTMKEAQQPPSPEQYQALLRILHKTLVANNMSEEASSVMLELLGTYTTENASQARDDAHYCITESIRDPETFILDHLLALKPVRFLEGDRTHDLLNIFVHDKLRDYIAFYNSHKEFITATLGLDHEACVRKMRILTFVQLAQDTPEMSFASLQDELDLPRADIEEFVVEALSTGLVAARIDQMASRVLVTTVEHRTFGPDQWRQVASTLERWRQDIVQVKDNLAAISNAVVNAL